MKATHKKKKYRKKVKGLRVRRRGPKGKEEMDNGSEEDEKKGSEREPSVHGSSGKAELVVKDVVMPEPPRLVVPLWQARAMFPQPGDIHLTGRFCSVSGFTETLAGVVPFGARRRALAILAS